MLEQLTIRGLALIECATLSPSRGLTVISGETGGGKSLIVQALRLLRGEKARADIVRRGATAASVDGVFRVESGERSAFVRELYEEVLGTQPEDDRIVVSRVLDAKGRSRARIDGRPVPLRELQRFGALLLEVHGQGANRSLMRSEIQTELVDAFAGGTAMRRDFAQRLSAARAVAKDLEDVRSKQRERRERIEWLQHCLGEIDAVDLRPGEHAELARDVKIQGSWTRMRETLGATLDELREREEGAVLDRLRAVERDVEGLVELDDRLRAPGRMLDEAAILIDEAGHELASALDRLDFDPQRAEADRVRLAELDRLLERFGPSERELLETEARMREELEQLRDESRTPEALEDELERARSELGLAGDKLTKLRKRAAKRLSTLMIRELGDLGMSRVRVEVRVVEDSEVEDVLDVATPLGTSEVDVFLAPNPGEALTPLRNTASGGEVARVMLVLKKILADADLVPLLIFDEADAEIGGRLGLAVGRKLRDVARQHQVVCITHLPQIAAFADLHCMVRKSVHEESAAGATERTVAELRALSDRERQHELASMARGEAAVDDDALHEAGRLLELADT